MPPLLNKTTGNSSQPLKNLGRATAHALAFAALYFEQVVIVALLVPLNVTGYVWPVMPLVVAAEVVSALTMATMDIVVAIWLSKLFYGIG